MNLIRHSIKRKAGLLFSAFLLITTPLFSQDLINEADEEEESERVTASYKNSRVINAQSLETTPKNVLDFRISHRFGRVNGGMYELFGLDESSVRIGFDYGITKTLQAGFGRSSFEKTYDGYLKYRVLWQTTDNRIPLSIILYSGMSINSLRGEC